MTKDGNHLLTIRSAGRRFTRGTGRVRLVLSVDTAGGAWGAIIAIASGLAGRGFDVTLAMLGPEATPRQQAEIEAQPGLRAISAHPVAARQAGAFGDLQAAGQAVARLANVLAVDLVVLHHPMLAAFGPFHAPVVVSPDSRDVIVASRSSQTPGYEWRARLLRSGYQSAAGIVAPTHADARDIIDAHRVRRPPRVIRRAFAPLAPDTPPVDLAPYAMAAHQAADGRENLAMLNEAAFLSPTPVMLTGASAGKIPATGHLWAIGPVTPGQVQRWLANAQVFMSTTTGDTDGETVWRAAQAGCALVLADAPDYRELWDGAAAFVPAGDEIALAWQLNAMMADEEKRQASAQEAKKLAGAWSIDSAGLAWAELLADIAATTAHSSAA